MPKAKAKAMPKAKAKARERSRSRSPDPQGDLERLAATLLEEGKQQIFVQLPTGKTITLDVKASGTLDNIKRQIQDKEGIPSEQQELVLRLCESRTISEINTKNEPFISMYLMPMYPGAKTPGAGTSGGDCKVS